MIGGCGEGGGGSSRLLRGGPGLGTVPVRVRSGCGGGWLRGWLRGWPVGEYSAPTPSGRAAPATLRGAMPPCLELLKVRSRSRSRFLRAPVVVQSIMLPDYTLRAVLTSPSSTSPSTTVMRMLPCAKATAVPAAVRACVVVVIVVAVVAAVVVVAVAVVVVVVVAVAVAVAVLVVVV